MNPLYQGKPSPTCRAVGVTFRSDLGRAAVDGQVDAGNETGVVTGQKQCSPGDVGGLAQPLQGDQGGDLLSAIMAVSIGPGLRMLTRIPRSASSAAQVRAKERRAALVAA